ncbi:response regulator transcription factor [Chishuiella sp.]|uniref:response regulator transcription factor n=1 Tax=Chishuiella sp. TaxID=1969467 RepID=UPI0028AFA690|nr:response regulator transcription factor [Chishuiella sp.]
MNKILLVEDELHVADLIKQCLEEEGYEVTHVDDGLKGIDLLKNESFNLIILDILLPKMNGLEVCKEIRKMNYQENIPILILTALGSAENIVLGLDSGADDYLSKPFKLIELKARIRNLLKRSEYFDHSSVKLQNDTYKFADLEVNDYTKVVTRAGEEISLTSTEYRLLLEFIKNPTKVINRSDLLDNVWGINYEIGTNVVDVYVNYLRKKIEKEGSKKLIHTVTGMGYVLKDE